MRVARMNNATGRKFKLVLTDLQPHPAAWAQRQAEHAFVRYDPNPVDATAVRVSDLAAAAGLLLVVVGFSR